MNGVKREKGVLTTLRDRINLCDKDNTRAGIEVAIETENQMKKEKMRQEVIGRSKVVKDTPKVDSVELANKVRADMEEEPVL